MLFALDIDFYNNYTVFLTIWVGSVPSKYMKNKVICAHHVRKETMT